MLTSPRRRLVGALCLALGVGVLAAGPVVAPASAVSSVPAVSSAPSGSTVRQASDQADPVDVLSALDGFRLDPSRNPSVEPRRYSASRLDPVAARRALDAAPSSAQVADGAAALRLDLPTPEGTTETFSVVEDSVLAPGIAARHPEISTFAGTDVADPRRSVRLDLTPLGLHASVRGPAGQGAWYVDPAYRGAGTTAHVSYYGAAVPRDSGERPLERAPLDLQALRTPSPDASRTAAGELVTRRTFDLAFLTDPTYADYFGTANVLAAKVSLINRVDQIYNDDLGIFFRLIDQTDRLNLDTTAKATGTDGPCGASACFTDEQLSTCSGDLLTRNNFVLGQLVGADTFDIGHIGLGVAGGGIAGLGVVGGSSKASGCTGLPTPTGDFYAVDYVSHEMGHQMGGNHTFNGTQRNCSLTNRNGATSVEPGSGSSVMAYAGISDQDDLQEHSDPYMSQRSIDEITDVVTAEPLSNNEVQTVALSGFDADGDSVELTYPGRASVTITRGGLGYTALNVSSQIFQLTGCRNTLAGYDSATPALSDDGFEITFNVGSCRATDVQRIGVGASTGGASGFVGVQTDGGPETNQGLAAPTTNHAPRVTAPADRTIPARTPFTLTGSGSDLDAGQALSYLWEQNDTGSALPTGGTALVDGTKRDGPLFRVFGTIAKVTPEGTLTTPSPGENVATGSPTRTFPDLAQILAGTTNAETGACPAAPVDPDTSDDDVPVVPDAVLECFSEFLPTADYGNALTGSALHFRLTARDGNAIGGGTQFDDVTLDVDTSAGPFLVTSHTEAGDTLTGAGPETVTWDVNGTDAADLAPLVRISYSVDGGRTFPYVVAASTPNDGSEPITVPNVATQQGRIKVEAVDNYFFDLTDADVTIVADPGEPTTPTDPTDPTDPGDEPSAAPDTGIVGGVRDRSFVVGRSVRVAYAASDPEATFACRLDGAATSCPDGSVRLRGLAGGMHRFTVAARTADGGTDPTPARRVFSVVHDQRILSRITRGWRVKQDDRATSGHYLTTNLRGEELRVRVSRLRRVALLVAQGPRLGRLAVFVDRRRVGTVDLARSPARRRVLMPVSSFGRPATGTLRIRTLDRAPVRLDGVGLYTR